MNSGRTPRRTRVLYLSFLLGGLLVAGGFGLQQWSAVNTQNDFLSRQLSLSSRRSFSELSTYLFEIDSALQKSVFATSPPLAASLCTEIYGKAMSAQLALGRMPFSNVTLEQTSTFVSRVGDYALSLSRRAAAQEVFNDEDLKNLRSLSETAAWLSQSLIDMQRQIENGEITLETLEQTEARLKVPESAGSGGGFQAVESEFPEVPTLIYDGPFSQHLEQQKPRSLEGFPEISEDEAKQIAADFFGLDAGALKPAGKGEGKLPFYGFSAESDGGFYAAVPRQGGIPLLMYRTPQQGEAQKTKEEALEIAAAFLREHDFPEMHQSYHMENDGILTVNFAATQDGVILYPDLVKVSVSLSDGGIAGFEAEGYIMNHMTRSIPAAAISDGEAEKQVASGLSVLSHKMAIIPTAGKNEVFCHEFICENPNGVHCLVYVNAQTGTQEKILLLIEDESGTLTV